jgi:hypothetical protein
MPDRELLRFVTAPVREGRRAARVHPARAVWTVAVVAAVAAVLVPTCDELRFHFHSGRLIDIGDAVALPSGSGLPIGSHVRAHVVLGNRAAEIPVWRPGSLRFGPIVVRQVLGSPLWIEYTKERQPTWGPFVEADVEGRVIAFDGDLSLVRDLVASQGADVSPDARVLIVDERPGSMITYVLAWAVGTVLALWSLLSLVRAARPRVVDDAAHA